jgi:hypothetical protein
MGGKRRQDHDPDRRRLLRDSIALAGGVAVAGLAGLPPARGAGAEANVSDPHPALGRRLSPIAIGSCADQYKPHPDWEPVLPRDKDL